MTARLNFVEQHALRKSKTVTDRHWIKRFLEPDAHAQIGFCQRLTIGMEIDCPAISGTAEEKSYFAHEIQKLRLNHVLQGDRSHWPARLAAIRTT